ncbi:tRNA1(Val) (adenine(37)-N6)-methyltransferase [Amaricoccus tamworthensis]|uniref:tRNA1(Val) (adenine(37)-N6)-methyltransferase n=1 Tax=Amaricoccus tamworthensis TaxID=57002 RepID=UPI003C7DB342
MGFSPDQLSRDGFLGGALHIFQPLNGYRAATDPVFLAAFTPARPGQSVLDLGCGVGTAGLCLASRVGGIDLHGLEIQRDYADLAARNARENGISLTVHQGDILAPPSDLRQRVFDHVIMNPPYYRKTDASAATDAGRDRANREGEAELSDWIAAGLRRTAQGGRVVIVHRVERLGDILAALQNGAGGIEVLPIASRRNRPASRVLVRAVKSGRAPLILHAPLIVHASDTHQEGKSGDFTDTVKAILAFSAELNPNTGSI